ncbi:MAG: response regulator transcription factor [Chloroflexota bacterium]
MSQLSQYAADTPAAGDLGTAWTAQLVAEHARCARTDSAEVWRAAVDGWHVTGQVHDQAWALIRLATCELEAGDKKSAADALSEAIAIGTRLGAAPLVDAAEAVARRGRIDVRRDRDREQPAHQRRHGLTAREVEVLQLVAEGRSNDQIAKELFISPKTASVHVSHILTKLNVASRSEATTAAHRLGLLDEAAKS